MTTLITKTVRRKTRERFRSWGKDARQIIVSIEPGDVLGFRLLRARKTYYLPVAFAMDYAIRLEVAERKRRKAEERKKK